MKSLHLTVSDILMSSFHNLLEGLAKGLEHGCCTLLRC
jgi:hypothetical protein